MGKSKNGGTRSFLRGRVGSDVYSVGKDAQGKKQQVVRSLAESVANPQTLAQMKGRCIMSTVMQAVSSLAPIIDHSFDNVTAGQPNVSEFIKRNYALIKADVEANPATGNAFGIVKYGEKGAKQGVYVIAAGSAYLPAALQNAASAATLTVSADSLTFGAIKSALGLSDKEYFTLVGLTADGACEIARFRLGSALTDDTVVSSANISEVFAVEANCTPSISVAGMVISIALPNAQANSAIIISKFENGAYKHNDATLLAVTNPSWPYNDAIATYPVGQARLLNGGDFAGGEVEPEPVPLQSYALTITLQNSPTVTVKVDGQTINSGDSVEEGKTVNIAFSDPDDDKSFTATINSQAITLTGTTTKVGSFVMPSQASTLVLRENDD